MPTTKPIRRRQQEKTIAGKKYVLRKRYTKKAYHRKGYVRSDGIRVRAARVGPTKVKATWIVKRGLTHGKYGMIPLKDFRHLKTFGYSFGKSVGARHTALKKAVHRYGRNWAVRRLTALANVRPQLPKYQSLVRKARSDVAYIERMAPSRTSVKRHRAYHPRGLAHTQGGRSHVRRTHKTRSTRSRR